MIFLLFFLFGVVATNAQTNQGIRINQTPVFFGTNGNCLSISSSKVSQGACGGAPSGAAGGALSGTYPNPGLAVGALPNGMTATTQAMSDNTTKVATDAFVLANSSGALPVGPANCAQLANGGDTAFLNGCANQVKLGNPAATTGSELITNGGFVGGTIGWTLASGDVVYGSSDVVCTYTTTCGISQSIPLVAGTWYRVLFTVSQVANEFSYVEFSFATNMEASNFYSNGAQSVLFLADTTTTDTITFNDGNGNFYGGTDGWHLTGISVRAVAAPVNPVVLTGNANQPELILDDANFNMFFGQGSGNSSVTGQFNLGFGGLTLSRLTSGGGNFANGYQALANVTTGSENTASGINALGAGNPTFSVAVGTESLWFFGGTNSVGVGHSCFINLQTGDANAGLGTSCGSTLISASRTTVIGDLALSSATSVTGDTVLGYSAGKYELGSNAFYVDNQDRTNTAGDKAGALLYGNFNATPASQFLKVNGQLVQNVNAVNPFEMVKNSTSATAPSAGICDLRWIAGTNAGTGKIVAACGTSATEVTIADNVGGGF